MYLTLLFCDFNLHIYTIDSNRKRRNELLLLVENLGIQTNKFREHQSRELLIEILEKQLMQREKFICELEDKIAKADVLLEQNIRNG